MKLVLTIRTVLGILRYRGSLTGEKVGWVIFKDENSFSPTHQILVDPERGPVIICGESVYEVDPDLVDVIYKTEAAARDAYFEMENKA